MPVLSTDRLFGIVISVVKPLISRIGQERTRHFDAFAAPSGRVVAWSPWGNSITQQGSWDDRFPNLPTANCGIGSNATTDLLARLDDAIGDPLAISLLIGTNDLHGPRSGRDPTGIAAMLSASSPSNAGRAWARVRPGTRKTSSPPPRRRSLSPMARKGWGGTPPQDDDEAAKMIVDAATRLVERDGAAATTLSSVSDELEITRRTIYRYFAGTDDLFRAVALNAFDGYLAELERVTAQMTSAGDLLIETMALVIETLPQQPLLTMLLDIGRIDTFSRSMLAPEEIRRCRMILLHGPVDWAAAGYDDQALDELVGFLIRIVQSMVIAPPDPPLAGPALRAYLRRWVGPSLLSTAPTPSLDR